MAKKEELVTTKRDDLVKNNQANISAKNGNSAKNNVKNENPELDFEQDFAEDGKKKKKEKKEKPEKQLSPKQLEKKLEQEKIAKKQAAKEQKYKFIILNELELQKKQFVEKQAAKKKIITNGAIFLLGTGIAVALALIVNIFLAGIALPIWGFTIFNILKSYKILKKLENPYELRKMLIIEKAKKEHQERNQKIIEEYKAEKKRINSLKKLPFKVLNSVAFMVSMFAVILSYFVFDIGVQTTALILFVVFTVFYFGIGLIMISVFYLVGEAKQKQMMLKLEEEKNKALIEEKLRSENTIRKNLESERKRFAEEERLRINEQIRLKAELEAAKLKQEQERKMYEDAEKEKMKLFHESKFIKQVLQPPSKAEIHKEAETIKNEFDHKILDEVNSNLTNLNLGGIENFTNIDKIAKEYTSGVLIPDEDLSEDSIENEMNNTFLNTLKNDEINENYEKNIEKNNINEEIPEPVSAEIETERKVSGKSFSILKQMLKDG